MNDRVVLVTGGAGNVGRTVSRHLLEQGWRVVVPFYKTDVPDALDELRQRFGARIFSFALDLTTERGAQEAVREVLEWGSRLDGVVHLVGGYTGGQQLTETSMEAWDRMMDLNLKSAWLVSRFAVPPMLERGGGSMVFVSSRSALEVPPRQAAYAVSKAALLTLVRALATEFGEAGLHASALLPRTVDTEANRRAMPDADRAGWSAPDDIARTIVALLAREHPASNGDAIPV